MIESFQQGLVRFDSPGPVIHNVIGPRPVSKFIGDLPNKMLVGPRPVSNFIGDLLIKC